MFVQYYDILGKDAVYHKINCMCLNWERYGEDEEQRKEGMIYALCPLDIVRGRVHVVQSNPLLEMLHERMPDKKTFREGLKLNAEWKSEVFYVNMSIRNNDMPIAKNSSN